MNYVLQTIGNIGDGEYLENGGKECTETNHHYDVIESVMIKNLVRLFTDRRLSIRIPVSTKKCSDSFSVVRLMNFVWIVCNLSFVCNFLRDRFCYQEIPYRTRYNYLILKVYTNKWDTINIALDTKRVYFLLIRNSRLEISKNTYRWYLIFKLIFEYDEI